MSDARQNILEKIRQANQHVPQVDSSGIVSERLQRHPRGPHPQWNEDLLTRFTHKVEQAAASYADVKTDQDIVNAVMAYLAEHSLEEKLVRTFTPILNELNWPASMQVETRAATSLDMVVLVEADAAIAETGSVVICSSENTPVSLNFLPDHYLCVVRKNSIVNTMEDIWDPIRQNSPMLPRAINIITGPSRTADVEQIIQMGAHGPRRVHLLLLDQD